MQKTSIDRLPWNLAKLKRAEKLLKKGLSPKQIGRKLSLPPSQIEDLEIKGTGMEMIELETFPDWRKRKNEEVERCVVTVVERHLKEIMEDGGSKLLDPDTMGTVKDASTIAYLWLRKDTEQNKTITHVNFNVLANAKPISFNEEKVFEISDPSTR